MTALSDQLLLGKYCRGDRAAFDALFQRYAARVHATAYRLTGDWEDAEDVLQDVFVRLAHGARAVRSGAALATWIYRVTVNCAMDCLRRRRRDCSLDENERQTGRVIAVESLRRKREQEQRGERDSLLSQVEALIPRLPERQAQVLVLRAFQGLTHRQIAMILDCSEVNCRSLYSLACRKLRELVSAETKAQRKGVANGREGASLR